MEVIYSKSYIERGLYILEYKGKYLMVYASSGMNPGRKGRILPFAFLADPPRATLRSEVPGYIYKEFYIQGKWTTHDKNPYRFTPFIEPFLEKLEAFLEDKKPPVIDCSHITSHSQIRPIAQDINKEMHSAIGDLEPFDWIDLNEGDL